MTETARFVDDDKDLNLPKVQATDGQTGYDVAGLLRSTGNVMLDPGFVNTASCESEITYIDGNNGVLRYRGYPIEQLAEHASFLETAFLVLYGDLPTASELNSFEEAIRRKTLIDERMRDLFRCFPRRSHPMPVLSAGIMALSTFSGSTAEKDLDSLNKATLSLLAKVPTLAAFAYKNSMGQPTLYPDNSLGYVENFIRMSFGFPTEPYEFNEAITRGLEVLLILHADHEQNCSTSTVRMVASSGANLHADEILKLQTGRKDLLEIAKELEETALNDDYFKERKLYPNVDFYSGLIYEAMGFPLNMFTVLFTIGRLPGWIAQYREQVTGSEKIWRPRQIYTGCDVRDWIPFEQRS